MTSMADTLARNKERAQGIGTNRNAVKFGGQDYNILKKQCLESGCLFEDDLFPAGSKSLGYDKLGPSSSKSRRVVWKRPTELCRDPRFIDGGATRTDIRQGILGDCWLLSAIASLTLDKEILARVVPPGQTFDKDYAGIFHFQFWQFGEWVDVVIDDRLPTRDGELLFVHSAEGSEFWSALLEKAYAKVNGSYEALSGGFVTEAFEDFTGGISELYTLDKPPPQLFKIIRKALERGSLLGCTIKATSANVNEPVTDENLVEGHAYSLTGAQEVHVRGRAEKLVRVRNPWGQVEWTGAWSDGSQEWDYVPAEEKEKLRHAAIDGEFWMSFSDFKSHYDKLEICNLTPDTLTSDKVGRWNSYQFDGEWRVGSTAGGCFNNIVSFSSNPQFSVKLQDVDDDPLHEDTCTILVGLMQKDSRKQRNIGRKLLSIGFAIYKVPDEYKGRANIHLGLDVLRRQSAVAMYPYFTPMREVCERFYLPPGEYVIIPSTFDADKKGSFILRVFSENQATTRWVGFSRRHDVTSNMEEAIDAQVEEKDGSKNLDLVEFHGLWLKIQKYLKIFKRHNSDNSGTMSSHDLRAALSKAGFQINSDILQIIVGRYADANYAIDFDCFVGCLIRLEMLFSESARVLQQGY
ncbi:hypothetical protein SKAU_G00179900 [Synaphobranchus kaupii]|uniref:Calpain 2 n=1 Tax=Synaphobranchus kaupii TaxID=118154 RepID=A0A9Q1FM47_SYNKA|nr:hypothetical protein SKAU_G00179900 [Synaphobranchus kaupii]